MTLIRVLIALPLVGFGSALGRAQTPDPEFMLRISFHDHRPVTNVRQQHGRDVDVVLNECALGDLQLRPEQLAQVREPNLTTRHRNDGVVDIGRDLNSWRLPHGG